jgi:hypothetical protein
MNLISNRGGTLNLSIVRGISFGPLRVQLTLNDVGETPIDLTGVSVYAHLRRKASDADAVLSFDVSVVDPVLGMIEIGLTDDATIDVPAVDDHTSPASQSVWDLLLVDAAGRTTQILQGTVTGYLSATHL